MESIVALDIETTGLNPEGDAITEIGAVRFLGRRIEAEWHTLINPGRRIPPEITQLTGITDAMVRGAPMIHDVLEDLDYFVGDAPILGHNVRFDLSFYRKLGLFHHNEPMDTYEMAAILLPTAGRYNLGALGQFLGVLLPATHRALDDAKVTHAIFTKLYDIAMDLPIEVLAEIVRLGDKVAHWNGYGLFFEVLRTRSREKVTRRGSSPEYYGRLFDVPVEPNAPPLQSAEQLLTLDIEEVAATLEHGGAFSRHFKHLFGTEAFTLELNWYADF